MKSPSTTTTPSLESWNLPWKKCGLGNSLNPGQSGYVRNSSVMDLHSCKVSNLFHDITCTSLFAAASCPTKKSSSKTANVTKTMIISLWTALDISNVVFMVEDSCIWFQNEFVFVTCSLCLQNPFQLAWGVHCIYSWVSYPDGLLEPWKLLPVWCPQEPVTLSQCPGTKSHNGAAAMDCSCRVRSEPKARRRLWVWHSDLGLRHERNDGDGVPVCLLLVLLS